MNFINNTPFVYFRDDNWYICGCGHSCPVDKINSHMSTDFIGYCKEGIRIGKTTPYQCICGRDYKEQDHSENHITETDARCMQRALKVKSLECEICDLDFIKPVDLRRHLQTKRHIEKVNGTYKDISLHCKVCDIRCLSKAIMETHLKTKKHLARVEAPPLDLECKICDIKCLSQAQMKKHLETKKHLKKVTQANPIVTQ